MTIEIKIEVPSINPPQPCYITPITRDTKAATIKIYRIRSSKFSITSSQNDLISLSFCLFDPNLKMFKEKWDKTKTDVPLGPYVYIFRCALDSSLKHFIWS